MQSEDPISIDQTSPALEVAVYQISGELQDSALWIDHVNQLLQKVPGFMSRVVHRSLSSKSTWMDLIQWDSPKSAALSRKAFSNGALKQLHDTFVTSVELRKQFRPYLQCGMPPNLPLEKTIELAVYRVQPGLGESYTKVFDKMHKVLQSHPSFLYRQCGKALVEAQWYMDYIFWEDSASHSLASFERRPEMKAFFDMIYDVPYFHHFRIVPENQSYSFGGFI
ncbi:MAG: hypothetical protein AAF694_11285 [Bacteroidota bacterium]